MFLLKSNPIARHEIKQARDGVIEGSWATCVAPRDVVAYAATCAAPKGAAPREAAPGDAVTDAATFAAPRDAALWDAAAWVKGPMESTLKQVQPFSAPTFAGQGCKSAPLQTACCQGGHLLFTAMLALLGIVSKARCCCAYLTPKAPMGLTSAIFIRFLGTCGARMVGTPPDTLPSLNDQRSPIVGDEPIKRDNAPAPSFYCTPGTFFCHSVHSFMQTLALAQLQTCIKIGRNVDLCVHRVSQQRGTDRNEQPWPATSKAPVKLPVYTSGQYRLRTKICLQT
eukprot:1157479-Pelagomonas_calceolata.AAC.3